MNDKEMKVPKSVKIGTTTILRVVIGLAVLFVLSVCFLLLPELAREEAVENPGAITYPYLVGAYVLAIPIFISFYQLTKLANLIDQNKIFTPLFVGCLRIMKYCSNIFSLMVALGALMTIFFERSINPTEDVTHIVILGFIAIFASSVVAAAAALFERLFQSAVDIKSENDLTV